MAGASRFVTREYRVSDPLHASDQFARDIRACIQESHADTLMPISEASLLALLPVRETFDRVLIPFADLNRFQQISDKAAVLAAAHQCGIAVPAQQRVDSPDAGARLDLEALTYPIVVKPARSVAGEATARHKFSVVHAAHPARDCCSRVLTGSATPAPIRYCSNSGSLALGWGSFCYFGMVWESKSLSSQGRTNTRIHWWLRFRIDDSVRNLRPVESVCIAKALLSIRPSLTRSPRLAGHLWMDRCGDDRIQSGCYDERAISDGNQWTILGIATAGHRCWCRFS